MHVFLCVSFLFLVGLMAISGPSAVRTCLGRGDPPQIDYIAAKLSQFPEAIISKALRFAFVTDSRKLP